MVRQIQQSQMAPVAGMKFLAMQEEIGCGRSRIGFGAEVAYVRNTLLFVDYQILDDREILRLRLRY